MNNITMDDLFNNRQRVGKNINEIMKEKGHTKISFSKIAGITRPTLNKLINGESTSITTFTSQINSIINAINITFEDLLGYKGEEVIDAYYSDNSPENHELDQKAKQMFNILGDIIHLCELYY